ncbi:hypothetical protein C8R43DRAFT_1133163 [Mycena crocata]|nr:hypothetical protein C8R43DRAFT_1133163 [Mycena crocata]
MEKSPPALVWQPIPHDNHPVAIDPVAAQRIQLLAEQVRRLTEHAEANSAVGSDAASVAMGRSLSTMKREQNRPVQQGQRGPFAADALIHTDSDLRLTAGRVVDELPPTYVAA